MDGNKIECFKCNIKVPVSELDNHFLECQIQDYDTGNQNESEISNFKTEPIPDQSDNNDIDDLTCEECGKTFSSENNLKVSLL